MTKKGKSVTGKGAVGAMTTDGKAPGIKPPAPSSKPQPQAPKPSSKPQPQAPKPSSKPQ
jgi:hypothetical protein